MASAALPLRSCAALRATPDALSRAVLYGAAWGIFTAAGLTAINAWRYGGVCFEEAAMSILISIATGILTIGPLVAIGNASRTSLR